MSERRVLARAGDLEIRLATSAAEIEAAQTLRYRVFFEQGGAKADAASRAARRDLCRFDEVCDHLVAVDLATPGEPIVGAYRVLRPEAARFGFYSAAEFEVDALIARHPRLRFLELGRSCVDGAYRGRRALETLWRGVWAYALSHRVDVMFGCASLPGADPQAHAGALAALAAHGESAPEWRVAPAASARAAALPTNAERARGQARALPPLVKGYLRLGATVAPQAVIDEAFGATDVFVVLRVANIEARYLRHFAPEASLAA